MPQPTKNSKPRRTKGGVKSKQPDLLIGEMPVEMVNRTLGLELEPGEIIFTRAAQGHAAKRHPAEYPRCVPHLATIVLTPLYVGDDFRNGGKIEMIGRVVALNGYLLVAVTIDRDPDGRYHVCSVYPVKESQVENRKRRGYLRPALG